MWVKSVGLGPNSVNDAFWLVVISFDALQLVVICIDAFWLVVICFYAIWYVLIHFDSVWYVLMHFDSLWWSVWLSLEHERFGRSWTRFDRSWHILTFLAFLDSFWSFLMHMDSFRSFSPICNQLKDQTWLILVVPENVFLCILMLFDPFSQEWMQINGQRNVSIRVLKCLSCLWENFSRVPLSTGRWQVSINRVAPRHQMRQESFCLNAKSLSQALCKLLLLFQRRPSQS